MGCAHHQPVHQRGQHQRQRQRTHVPVDHRGGTRKEAQHQQVARRHAHALHHAQIIEGQHHAQPYQTEGQVGGQQPSRPAQQVSPRIRVPAQRVVKTKSGQEQKHVHPAVADLLHIVQKPAKAQLRVKKHHPQDGRALDFVPAGADCFLHAPQSTPLPSASSVPIKPYTDGKSKPGCQAPPCAL